MWCGVVMAVMEGWREEKRGEKAGWRDRRGGEKRRGDGYLFV